jgi:predicted O-methyltransferase YrrM
MTPAQLSDVQRRAVRRELPADIESQVGGSTLEKSSLRLIGELLEELNAKTVIEFGSGLSTRYMADTLPTGDEFVLYSVENSRAFLDETMKRVKNRGKVVPCHAPLETYRDKGKSFVTYSAQYLSQIPAGKTFDMVLIDGPLGYFDREAPLYQVKDHLTAETVVLLDDSHRPNEQMALANWKRYWPEANVHSFGLEEPMTAVLIGNPKEREAAPWSVPDKSMSLVKTVGRLAFLWNHRLRGDQYRF